MQTLTYEKDRIMRQLYIVLTLGMMGGLVIFSKEAEAAPNCSASQMAEISRFTSIPAEVKCNINMSSSDIIRRPIVFRGAASSNVTVNCNGGMIAVPAAYRDTVDAIDVESTQSGDQFSIPENITVKNCEVFGSIRISSTYYIGNAISGNDAGPSTVMTKRNTSPRYITYDNLTVTNANTNKKRKDTVYFEQGVTYSTLKNSKVIHDGSGVPIYLAPDAAYNVIYNNEFHNERQSRELFAIDGAEHNRIERNWFSGLSKGGIYLYRNCGENGNIRYGVPRKNTISDNIFYYKSYSGSNPAIYLGSRFTQKSTNESYCDLDSGKNWTITDVPASLNWDQDWESSSSDDRDFARDNTVTGNRICNRNPNDVIKTQIPFFNHSNTVNNNTRITCSSSNPIPR